MLRLSTSSSLVAACFLSAVSCTWGGGGSGEITVPVDSVFEYDTQADTWTQKAPMPTPRSYSSAVAVNGKVYVIGGQDYPPTQPPPVEAFDPVTNTWERKANAPETWLSCVVVSDKIYASAALSGKMYEYDTVLDSWTEKANPAPVPISIVIGTDIYGFSEIVFQKYDTITDTWSPCPDVPVRHYTPVVASGKLFAVAGSNSDTETPSQVWEYDPVTNLWSQKSDMLIPQYLPLCAVIGNKIYTIDEEWHAPFPPPIIVQEYDTGGDTWVRKSDFPEYRYLPIGGVFFLTSDSKIYLLTPYWLADEFDPVADTWASRAMLSPGYSNPAVCALGAKIYLIGGWYMQ